MYRYVWYSYCEFTRVPNASGLPVLPNGEYPTGKTRKSFSGTMARESAIAGLEEMTELEEVTGGHLEEYIAMAGLPGYWVLSE